MKRLSKRERAALAHWRADGFSEFWLRHDPSGYVSLRGAGEYPEYSVLAGGYREHDLETWDTEAEALEAFPSLPIVTNTGYRHPLLRASVSDLPWAGFDPADAGERWDSDY